MADLRKKHLLLKNQPGWRLLAVDKVHVTECGCLELAEQGAGRPLVDSVGSFGGLALPTGFAVDANGDVYFVDTAACRIRLLRPCCPAPETLSCIGGCGANAREFLAPSGLAINARGDLLVVDRGNKRIQVFTVKGLALRSIWQRPGWDPFDVVVGPQCFAYMSDTSGGLIHVFDANGCWRRSWPTPAPTHLAMDREGSIYVVENGFDAVRVYDSTGKLLKTVKRVDEVPLLFCALSETAVRAAALTGIVLGEAPPLYEQEGQAWIGPLDSNEYQCEWHRTELRGYVPAGGTIRVDTFTSEAEKSKDEILAIEDERWKTRAVDSVVGWKPWDCLSLSPRGRFLWLRLTFTGEAVSTPSLSAIRVDYPRITSLEFLPAVYKQPEESRDFLNRFLSVLDHLRGATEATVERFSFYLGPRSTAESFLGWLAGWVGMTLENQWPVWKRRKLLEQSPLLYRDRGKPAGLARHLEIYLGRAPAILELFRLRRWAFTGSAKLGDATLFGKTVAARLQLGENSTIGDFQLLDTGDPALDAFSVYAHRFTVVIAGGKLSDVQLRCVNRIVEMSKPAHTLARVVMGDGRLIIGKQSFVGVDTVVGAYPSGVQLGDGALGQGSVLSPSNEEQRPPTWRIGRGIRIGSGTVLD
jgi:phage tail-like protein